MTVPRLLVSVPDAAEAIGITKRTFYRDVMSHVENVRLGGRRLVVFASLEAYVAGLPRETSPSLEAVS